MEKQEIVNRHNLMTRTVWNILEENYVTINDNLHTWNGSGRRTVQAILQDDPHSPLLINVLAYDVADSIVCVCVCVCACVRVRACVRGPVSIKFCPFPYKFPNQLSDCGEIPSLIQNIKVHIV